VDAGRTSHLSRLVPATREHFSICLHTYPRTFQVSISLSSHAVYNLTLYILTFISCNLIHSEIMMLLGCVLEWSAEQKWQQRRSGFQAQRVYYLHSVVGIPSLCLHQLTGKVAMSWLVV
jgi:hypothetical protein